MSSHGFGQSRRSWYDCTWWFTSRIKPGHSKPKDYSVGPAINIMRCKWTIIERNGLTSYLYGVHNDCICKCTHISYTCTCTWIPTVRAFCLPPLLAPSCTPALRTRSQVRKYEPREKERTLNKTYLFPGVVQTHKNRTIRQPIAPLMNFCNHSKHPCVFAW